MPWYADGNCKNVEFHFTEYGNRYISCSEVYQFFSFDSHATDMHADIAVKLKNSKLSWHIFPSSVPESGHFGFLAGVWPLIKGNLNARLAALRYYGAIQLEIVLPDEEFEQHWTMFRNAITSDDLFYHIVLDLNGFRDPSTKGKGPTAEEFINGELVMPDSVSFRFGCGVSSS